KAPVPVKVLVPPKIPAAEGIDVRMDSFPPLEQLAPVAAPPSPMIDFEERPASAAPAAAPSDSRRRMGMLAIGGGAVVLLVVLLVGLSGGDDSEEGPGEGRTENRADAGEHGEKAPEKAPSKVAATTAPATTAPSNATMRIEANRPEAWVMVDGGAKQDLPVTLTGLVAGKTLALKVGASGCRDRTVEAVVGEKEVLNVYLPRISSSGSGGSGSGGSGGSTRRPGKRDLAKNPFGG
ncbi:MAG: hypothetical protein L0206_05130, partial [Actinobacteria bacterium]|nr:hypothetical protein [Actinomycetota bacterium]